MNLRDDSSLTRGELALMLKVTERTVGNCERSLSLDRAKIQPAGHRTIRYSVVALRRLSWFRRLVDGE